MTTLGLRSSLFRVALIVWGSIVIGIVGNFLHPHPLALSEPVISLAEMGQCSAPHPGQTFEWHPMTVEEAIELCKQSRRLVIADLRTALEYAQGHIPKAVHLPCHGEKGQTFLSQLDVGTPLLLYDNDGMSLELQSATEAAIRNGVKEVYVLQGGFQAWEEHGAAESGLCPHCKL